MHRLPDQTAIMERVARDFNASFASWGIELPSEDLAARRAGRIHEGGWAIWYCFGKDEQGEYMDYYASHRMTNDRHLRLRPSGDHERLPAIQDMRRVSADPDEDARLEREYFEYNQRVEAMLEAKGFRLRGDEPFSIGINRILHTTPSAGRPSPSEHSSEGHESQVQRARKIPAWAAPAGCQPRIAWTLPGGRDVRIDGISISLTYGGLLEGRPDEHLNREIRSKLVDWAARLYREPVHVIPADPVADSWGGIWLPPIRLAALLTSGPVRDGSGSRLTLCGFAEPFYDRPLGSFLPEWIGDLPWEKISRDFLH